MLISSNNGSWTAKSRAEHVMEFQPFYKVPVLFEAGIESQDYVIRRLIRMAKRILEDLAIYSYPKIDLTKVHFHF
jgi:hypothetical protein